MWAGMLVFDLVSFFVLPARCHNHNTSSVSQVVDILRLLRDVGGGDLPMRTCQCHLLLLLTQMVFASKMWLLRGAQRVMMFVGVLHSLSVWFSHVALCEGDCSGRRTRQYGSHVTKTLAHHSCSGEFVLCTPCALECVSCESPVLALAGWRTGVLAPACALSFTQ